MFSVFYRNGIMGKMGLIRSDVDQIMRDQVVVVIHHDS